MPTKLVAHLSLEFLTDAQLGDVDLGLTGTWKVSNAVGWSRSQVLLTYLLKITSGTFLVV